MKKYMIIILSMCLLLSFAGCRHDTAPEQGEQEEPEVRDLEIEVVEKRYSDEFEYDGVTVAAYDYLFPYLRQSDERGDEIVKEFNDFIEKTALDMTEMFASDIVTSAQDDYDMKKNQGQPWENGYYLDEMSYQTVKSESYLGVLFDRVANYGGAYPSRDCVMMMYDLNEGKFFEYTDVTDDINGYKSAITENILAQIKENELYEDYYDDYEEAIRSLEDAQFMFDEEGLTVLFPEYSIAPHAAGEQVFMVVYPELEPYFNDYAMTVLYEYTGVVG